MRTLPDWLGNCARCLVHSQCQSFAFLVAQAHRDLRNEVSQNIILVDSIWSFRTRLRYRIFCTGAGCHAGQMCLESWTMG